jgi:hypothetical protein
MAQAVGSVRSATLAGKSSAVVVSRNSVKRSSGRASSTQTSNRSLLSIPGIGKRTQDQLQNASVDSVAKLCDMYIAEHGRKKGELIKFLKVC